MRYRTCGESDLELSVLGAGCWQFGTSEYWGPNTQAEIDRIVHRAFDLGVTFFDTAEVYNDGHSEAMLGEAIEEVTRDEVIIASKVAPSHAYADELVRRCEQSLRRLGTSYLDLYLIHWPLNARSVSFFTESEEKIDEPPELAEALEAIDRLVRQGKIRYGGLSNYGPQQLGRALELSDDLVANEVAYNLLSRAIEYEVLPMCRERNVGVIGYSTLMQGLLTSAYARMDDLPDLRTRTRHFRADRSPQSRHGESGAEPQIRRALEEIDALCEETGYSRAELAVKWPLTREGVTSVLVGSTDLEHLEANARAAAEPLEAEVTERLDAITEPVKEALGTQIDYFEGAEQSRSY